MLAQDQVSMLIQVRCHDYRYHDYRCYVIVTGLPCDSLALDEDRVYWTENGLAVVFYVTRDDRNSLLSYSVPNRDSVIVSSSPGVQQLPQQGQYIWYSNGGDNTGITGGLYRHILFKTI